MGAQNFSVSWRTITAEPITINDTAVVPEAQALTVRWPNGGWVWNRPTAVYIYRQGQNQRLPIVDITKLTLIALGVAVTMTSMIIRILAQIKPEKPNE